MRRRPTRRANPWKIIFLVVVIGALVYFNRVVAPTMPQPFLPTPTETQSPEAIVNQAEQLYSEGKLTQAVAAYKQAIIAAPGNPAYYIELARMQVYAGQYEEAQKSAENALLLNQDNSQALAVKAWALYYMNKYDDAETVINQAIKLDENNATAYAYYAEILVGRGNFEDIEKAINISQKAAQLAPNTMETHRARGAVLIATANYEEAVNEYKTAIAMNDKLWDLHYLLGVAYRILGEYDLAQQEMLAAIAFNPKNPDIPTDLSRTYATQGQFGKAVQYAEQAVKLDPSNARLHGNLGFMYYKNGDYDKAIGSLTLALRGGTAASGEKVEGLPLTPGRVAEYYSVYGLALARRGRCADAVPVFEFILQNTPAEDVAAYNAGEGNDFCMQAANGKAVPTP
jgi:tetratricopeptide (TPR) repeat protein